MKDGFIKSILVHCYLRLEENNDLVVYMPGSSFNQTFSPKDEEYIELLLEYGRRREDFMKYWEKRSHLLEETACKMAIFFDHSFWKEGHGIEYQYCIEDAEENYFELEPEEFHCFEKLLAEAIDRGFGLRFNTLKKEG